MSAPDHKSRKNAAMADIRVVEAILRRWDPIGVEPGVAAPADEYDSYAPHIVSMVKGGCTVQVLAAHLESLATETMGMGPSSSLSLAHSLKFATEVIARLQPSNYSLERTRER